MARLTIQQLSDLFDDDKQREKIVPMCQKSFDAVDDIAEQFKLGKIANPEACNITINKLSGLYMILKKILSIAETKKKNTELWRYEQIRIGRIKDKEKKFTDAAAKQEASYYVASYRAIRNVLEAYVEMCKQGISSCQSILKAIGEEPNIEK